MLQISIILSLFLMFDSYLLGKSVCKLFKWDNEYFPLTTIGFLIILGAFQLFIFIFVKFQITVYLLILIQYVLLLMPLFIAWKVKIQILPTKKEFFWIVGGFIVVVIFCLLMEKQTLGETAFDSNFYLSMVIENSSSTSLGKINGYTGNIGEISSLHSYQGFYYFHSLLLKNIRNIIHLDSVPLTPIYLWTTAIMYFYMLSDILFHSIHFFLEKKKWFPKLVGLLFALVYFTNYFNISFNFYGNTWKTLNIACNMLVIYDFIKFGNRKGLLLLIFLNSSLISFSSSGFFIATFIQVSFFFYLIWKKERDYRIYFEFLITCLALLIFAMIYFADTSFYLSIAIFIFYCIAAVLICIAKKFNENHWNVILQGFKIFFFVIVIALIIISYLVHNSMFTGGDARFNGYSFFFRLNSLGDMTLNYFQALNRIDIIRNSLLWLVIAIGCLLNSNERTYKFFLLLIIILFVNPLVTPAAVKYMTNIVYSRCFEIFINPFCLILFFKCFIGWFDNRKIVENVLLFIVGICTTGNILYNVTTYYSNLLIPSKDYNPIYRITNDQWQLYVNLIEEIKISKLERPIILNQDIGVKAYVNNISVLIDANTARSAPAYSDLEIDAPSEWLNIFYVRDYYGQHVWNQEPDYSKICEAIIESNCDYVIMDKDVVISKEDLFLPLWFDARACCDVIYENDKFVLLKVRK
ncbi:hypothetical protein [Holdemania massiliensis]|uniref:hypothetical protein n=1 Tax=Holdemania massiliensis TaxID=1468449 RepID=UPI0035221AE1